MQSGLPKIIWEASYVCAFLVEQYAKYDFKWEGYGSKFSNYSGKVKKPYVLTIFGDKIKLQNGFGAWKRKQYSCDYNVKEKKPLKVTFNWFLNEKHNWWTNS